MSPVALSTEWLLELCEGQEKELPSQQQWFPFKATWKIFHAESSSAEALSSGQKHMSPLQADWALQERLPRLVKVHYGNTTTKHTLSNTIM